MSMRAFMPLALASLSACLVVACDDESSELKPRATSAAGADGGPAAPDATTDGIADADDIPVATRACDPSKPFATIKPLAELNTADNEYLPRLTSDELVLYFHRNNIAFRAERTTRDQPFGPAAAVLGVPTGTICVNPSEDDREIHFAVRAGSFLQIQKGRRASRAEAFGNFTTVFSRPASDSVSPFVRGTELFFHDVVPGDNPTANLWRAVLADGGVTSGPVTELNSVAAEGEPTFSADALTIYFHSARVAPGQIWSARRETVGGSFQAPAPVAELASATGFTSPGMVSTDGCRIYFYSNRAGNSDIYVATRPP